MVNEHGGTFPSGFSQQFEEVKGPLRVQPMFRLHSFLHNMPRVQNEGLRSQTYTDDISVEAQNNPVHPNTHSPIEGGSVCWGVDEMRNTSQDLRPG